LKESQANCYQAAVGTRDGDIYLSGNGLGGKIVTQEDQDAKKVQSMCLRSWISKNITSPAIIKMDIEGYERELIPHIIDALPVTCAFFLETHEFGGLDEKIITLLETRGFNVKLLRRHSLPGDMRVFKLGFPIWFLAHDRRGSLL
jgi:hypothetical protein